MKYPIGIQTFEQIRQQGYVYVDKTALIYKLVTRGKIYFLSRPRRFGKSLLLSTLKAYFQGKKELFKGLAMEALETEWNAYPIFHLDFNGEDFTKAFTLDKVLVDFVARAETEYGIEHPASTLGSRFCNVIAKAKAKYGRGAVVLVDEYDKPLLDTLGLGRSVDVDGCKVSLEDYNRNVLKAFYSIFKLADEHLQFVMLTGVTKFSQISVFSGFNQPNDISMSTLYDTLCGITEAELDSYFSDEMKRCAREEDYTYEEFRSAFRDLYDGYHFSRRMLGVYNPFSVLNALSNHMLDDYWFRSGSPTYLIRLMEHFDENIDELVGKDYAASEFIDYRADTERPLPMLYQSGYLTIKGYKKFTRSFRLDFPNNEVKGGFLTMVANSLVQRAPH